MTKPTKTSTTLINADQSRTENLAGPNCQFDAIVM